MKWENKDLVIRPESSADQRGPEKDQKSNERCLKRLLDQNVETWLIKDVTSRPESKN